MTIWIVLGVVLLLVIAAVAYFATRNSNDDRSTGPRGQGRGRRNAHSVGGQASERDARGQGGQPTHRSHSETTRETPRVQAHDAGDPPHSSHPGHAGGPSEPPDHEPSERRLRRGDAPETDDTTRQ